MRIKPMRCPRKKWADSLSLFWKMIGMTPFYLATQAMAVNASQEFVFPSEGSGLVAQMNKTTPLSTANPAPFLHQIENADYANNEKVAVIRVKVAMNNVPADGQTPVALEIRLLDKEGIPLKGEAVATIEVSGGRLQIPGATTDEFGPGRLDLDKSTTGVQLKVVDGYAQINLLAPFEAQEVKVRITAGRVQAQGEISFIPDLREMIAVGLIEGIIQFNHKSPLQLGRARQEDGFEKEIKHFAWAHGDGKRSHALRTAFFLKGKIRGDALLTMAYDSDKETHHRLFRDIRPDEYYPVYGDASIKGFDAQSMSRLYVRMDKEKSYVLWGDFNTGENFSQLRGGGSVADLTIRDLGNYSRSMNGIRTHYEKGSITSNIFASKDRLIQFVEEFPGIGTSGPFAVSKRDAVSGSEKVEVITRDRYQPAVVLSVELLARYGDYSFEPFSGRILLREPLASVDPNGNPKSLRVTYEVDTEGEDFWIYGVDAQVKITEKAEVGGSYVRDKNPYAPYTLMSGNIAFSPNENTKLVAEIARSKSMLGDDIGKSLIGNPYSLRPANLTSTSTNHGFLEEVEGNAWRIEARHQKEDTELRAYYASTDPYFNNPAASLAQGRREAVLKATHKVNDSWQVYAQALESADRVAKAKRDTVEAGAIYRVNPKLELDLALTHTKEQAGKFGTFPLSFGSGLLNAPQLSNEVNAGSLNPRIGYGLYGNNYGLAGVSYNTTGIRLRSTYHVTDRFDLMGEYEHGVAGENYHRAAAKASYRFSEIGRLYGKYEWVTGVSSPQATDKIYSANAFVAGMETEYLPQQRLFSEYRMRDAISGQDLQWATGLRNGWSLSETVKVSTSAEYLQAQRGRVQGAYALTGAIEWRPSEIWLLGSRLEWRRTKDLTVAMPNALDGTTAQPLFFAGSDSWLSTVTLARKIDRDWTFLGRNYFLYTDNHGHSGNLWEDRLQLGLAYRDTERNRFNMLMRYEYWLQRNQNAAILNGSEGFDKHIISLHADYHPIRRLWLDGRFATKWQRDLFEGRQDRYDAYLVSGRVTYDISESWDVSGLGAMMYSPKGNSRQYAQGLELGYQVQENLWVSGGYNWRGFKDRDLIGADYMNQGFYMRLRFKFDEDIFTKKRTRARTLS